VFFSAGEASGDAYAAALAVDIATRTDVIIEGVGGAKLRRLITPGLCSINSSHWGAVSVVQSLRVAPSVLKALGRAKHALSTGEPGLFVPIDFGYLNIRLAREAKRLGWKVLYFVPPGSWRRDRQGTDLPWVTDEIVTPFPWSAEILRQMGANAHFFGHPLKEMIARSGARRIGEGEGLAILPGSRKSEIEQNLPTIAAALQQFDGQAAFALAPNVSKDKFAGEWAGLSGRSGDRFVQGDTYGVLCRSRAAVICSGTATLEAALCLCPMVVMYRLSKLTEIEVRLRGVRPKFISLPNILLDRPTVPELIQQDATPENVWRSLRPLLASGAERAGQIAAFKEIEQQLGPPDALSRTADLAVRMLTQAPPPTS
jgi:lipid-A-disaccharide synthase